MPNPLEELVDQTIKDRFDGRGRDVLAYILNVPRRNLDMVLAHKRPISIYDADLIRVALDINRDAYAAALQKTAELTGTEATVDAPGLLD